MDGRYDSVMDTPQTFVVTSRVDEVLAAKLDRIASERDRTRSAEVRRAIRQYVNQFADRDEKEVDDE